jgi:hypothetical protein
VILGPGDREGRKTAARSKILAGVKPGSAHAEPKDDKNLRTEQSQVKLGRRRLDRQ